MKDRVLFKIGRLPNTLKRLFSLSSSHHCYCIRGSRVIALHLGLIGGFRNTPDSKQNNTYIPSKTKLPLIIHVSLYKYKNKQDDISLSPFYYSSISTILRSGNACD